MWFKNVTLFEYIDDFNIDIQNLNAQLQENSFKPCSNTVPMSIGWVSPTGNDHIDLVHTANGCSLIALKTEEKIVPASVIKDQLQEKVDEIELRDNRKLRKKEKETLKEEIYQDLLPRAFTKSNTLYAYIDNKNGWLIVNTSSSRKAEDFSVMLRKAIGSLKIRLPDMSQISTLLTNWVLQNDYPQDYVVEDNCVLKDDDSAGVIRCQKQNLISEDITALVESGREVVQLSLSWKDQISFMITDDFVLKSIKYLEVIQDQAKDIHTESGIEQLDADFTIMTATLAELINSLVGIFSPSSELNSEDAEVSENLVSTEVVLDNQLPETH
ncbi:recombination-associated protein RdgC [Francisellaceae bacterium]|nr:recombination-associated protein RdgC [Francisellaceae bacterium]